MSALDRARAWFVAPLPQAADERTWFAPPSDERERRWMPPVPDDEPHEDAPAEVTSAAVLGRPGEVEPVAAALALSLRRAMRAKAATVAMIGGARPQEAANATGAARRLAARLEAHGFEPWARGRLAWVRLEPDEDHLAPIARRLALIGAPAVFAVVAPRTPAIDAALAEQDLLVLVTDDPDGPLARLAGLPGGASATVRPLHRTARALARAGRRAPAAIRRLLEEEERR